MHERIFCLAQGCAFVHCVYINTGARQMTPFYCIVSPDILHDHGQMGIWAVDDCAEMESEALLSMDFGAAESSTIFLIDPAKGTAEDVTKTIAMQMADDWLDNGDIYIDLDMTAEDGPAFAQAHAAKYLNECFAEVHEDACEWARGPDWYYGAPARL